MGSFSLFPVALRTSLTLNDVMLLETTDISTKDEGRRSLVFLDLKQNASTWLGELMHMQVYV